MKKILALLLGLTSSTMVFCQVIYPVGQVNVDTSPGGIAVPIQSPIEGPAKVLYLDEEWKMATVQLEGELGAFRLKCKYDVLNDRLEVQDGESLKVLSVDFIESIFFSTSDVSEKQFFITRNSFKNREQYSKGVYEVLNEGKVNLLKYHSYEVLKPDYNVALDVGSRDYRTQLTQQLFLLSNGQLQEIPNSNKKIEIMLKELCSFISKAVDKNKWKLKDETDLIEAMKYCNQNL